MLDYRSVHIYIPRPLKGCQMDLSWAAIKQPLSKFKHHPLEGAGAQ